MPDPTPRGSIGYWLSFFFVLAVTIGIPLAVVTYGLGMLAGWWL